MLVGRGLIAASVSGGGGGPGPTVNTVVKTDNIAVTDFARAEGNVHLSGPNTITATGGPGTTATWAFSTDGTVTRNGVQFNAGAEWNDDQPSPDGDFWIRAQLFSGDAPDSGPDLNVWHKLAGSGGAARAWTWVKSGISDTAIGSLRISIADDAAGSNILSVGVYGANVT